MLLLLLLFLFVVLIRSSKRLQKRLSSSDKLCCIGSVDGAVSVICGIGVCRFVCGPRWGLRVLYSRAPPRPLPLPSRDGSVQEEHKKWYAGVNIIYLS